MKISIARKFSGLLSCEVSRMGQDSVHGAFGGLHNNQTCLRQKNAERKYAFKIPRT